MDWREAEHVRLIIQGDAPSLCVKLRQLGNGEWVCVVAEHIHVWNEADWESVRGQPDIIVKRLIA